MQENNEVLSGIAARIESAVSLLISGDSIKAMSVLQRMLRILPKATQHNVDAANG